MSDERRQTLLRLAAVVIVMAVFAASASGYYHFLHYASRTGPFVPIPEKFDLSALSANTVYYYIAQEGPAKLYTGDSFTAVVSQLRLAIGAWDDVATSQLRVAYGGLFAAGAPQERPHIEVSFGEVPPGVYAYGGPTVRAGVQDGPGGPFVPILRSVVVFNPDLSERPSYATPFFLTAVHETGHALGLQHTFTSSVMSVEVTRASTKARPLGTDDIAGISLLYPTPDFAGRYGSISGRIATGDGGVHLASVVALPTGGQAVSALTNPDGTYRIDGLRPGQYYVYVHALPPAVQSELGPADLVLPLDEESKAIPAGDPFGTLFYPGTQDWHQAGSVVVKAAAITPDVNFSVNRQGPPALYDVETYSFPENQAVKPAYLSLSQPLRSFLVASGVGLMDGTEPRTGLSVTMLGGGPSVIPDDGVRPYPSAPEFLEIDFHLTPFSGQGPRHLVFTGGGETYVLPSAVTLVERRPPSIASLGGGTDGDGRPVVTVNGTNFGKDTQILFDGISSPITAIDLANGNITVTPPPAPLNYQARVVALNRDGQSSLFAQDPPVYTYDSGPSAAPAVTLTPASLAAGTEGMIEIQGTNLTFVEGQSAVGFGSSDVTVKKLWVVGPTLLRVNVAVAPQTQVSDTLVSVAAGLFLVGVPGGFHIAAPAEAPPTIGSDVRNDNPAEDSIYPGATAVVPVANLPASATAASVTLLLNDRAVPVLALDQNQLKFQVPADFAPGPAILRLATAGGGPISPVFVLIAVAPPVVTAVVDGEVTLDAQHSAQPGDQVTVIASRLGDSGQEIAAGRLMAIIGGIEVPALSPATPVADHPELHQFRTLVPPRVAAGDNVPLVISVDGRASLPYTITVTE
jgi:uncharacterized protein (TIGR03437 family)